MELFGEREPTHLFWTPLDKIGFLGFEFCDVESGRISCWSEIFVDSVVTES